ncbi:MAG TPA: hypothetical protein VEA40_08830 [Ramlibacter sp.]|nr:hypothetical protein [Ramlibacter sp.]
MEELLQNPAIQAGIAPFLAALVVAAPLARTRFLGLSQLAGFLVLAALAIGFSFESLTAVKKLVLVAIGSGIAAVLLEALPARRELRGLVLVLLGAGCIWMLWRLLAQREGAGPYAAGLLGAAYVIALAWSTLRVSADPVRGASAGLMIGLGTGALAILGASAVLGSAAIAVGASCGAALLVQMLRGQPAAVGTTVAFPAVAVAGLAGVLATQSGVLPWYCLLPVLAAPWATLVAPESIRRVWLKAVVSSALALVPMLAAVVLAWMAPAAS